MDSPRGRIYLIKGARGRHAGAGRRSRPPPRPLSRLPRLRDGVSLRRALRQHHRGCARLRRAARARARGGIACAAPASWRSFRTRAACARCSGWREVARGLGLWPLVTRLVDARRAAAAVAQRRTRWPGCIPARGRERARVGLLRGCVGDALFADVNAAAVRVLTAQRRRPCVVPPRAGLLRRAAPARRRPGGGARGWRARTCAAFPADLDAVLVTAAGCGSAMKEYAHLLARRRSPARAPRRFAARTRDVSEFLAELGLPPPARRLALRATYHDACHLAHAQGVRSAPRRLLAAHPGARAGGARARPTSAAAAPAATTSPSRPWRAACASARSTTSPRRAPSCVVVGNPGCALQIRAGLAARGLRRAGRASGRAAGRGVRVQYAGD